MTTTGAPCVSDTGAPAFTDSGAVLGVFSRFFSIGNPSNASCNDSTASYMVVADFAPVLRTAFDATGEKPDLEGRSAPGWYDIGEACSSDAVCAIGRCGATGLCEVDCVKNGCEGGLVCDAATRQCISNTTPVLPAEPTTTGPRSSEACSLGSSSPSSSGSLALVTVAGALLFGVARRKTRRV